MLQSPPTPAPIGAVVRAFAALRVDSPATRATVLAALGWPIAGSEAPSVMTWVPPPPPGPPETPPPPPRLAEGAWALPSTMTTETPAAPAEPAWLREVAPLPLPDPARAVPLFAKPIEPLLSPPITRAILTRLASVPVPIGEVDVLRLVETVATGRPLTSLPRRAVPTLAKGLDLLIDDGRGLDPFAHDVANLIDDLGLAVGHDRLSVRLFRGCPIEGVVDPVTAAPAAYVAPPGGTPVLAVTDLGLGERRSAGVPIAEAEWLAFAAELRARGNPFAVLVPGSLTQVPPAMRRALKPICWDRHTGARLNDRRPPGALPGEADDGAVRLAQIASIAGRIDPQLLRALRLHLAPDLGVAAEAGMYFSEFVQSAGVTGAVLRPEHQRRLQDQLAETDPDLLDRAWNLLYRLRTGRQWSAAAKVGDCSWLVAQEELTYLALRGLGEGSPHRAAAEQRLKQILKTLIAAAGTERERDAVIWTRMARARLPPAALDLEPMRHLRYGAALRGADTLAPAEVANRAGDDSLAYLVPQQQATTMPVWLRLVEGGLEASLEPLPEAHRIMTPALRPLPLVVDWADDAGPSTRNVLELNPPGRAFVSGTTHTVVITAPDGTRFTLAVLRRPILINVPPPPAVFVNRDAELKAALARCMAIRPADGKSPKSVLVRIFISQAAADRELNLEIVELIRPLEKERLIQIVTAEKEITLGKSWHAKISETLRKSDIVLIVLTPEYLKSDFCKAEADLAWSMGREGSTMVIPIIGRECAWQQTPLADFVVLPRDGRAIMDQSDPESRKLLGMEIEHALRWAVHSKTQSIRPQGDLAGKPRVVALVGPEGIGRFTLARRLVHDPAIQVRYPGGILWLGEDGQGYPRKWLRDYCQLIGEPAPFDDRNSIDRDAFTSVFAHREVLFVADHTTASDMLPTLKEHAEPGCTVLVIGRSAPVKPDERTVPIALAPLTAVPAGEAAAAFAMPTDAPPELIAFAEGNPLLLRLAAAGADRIEPGFLLDSAEKRLAGADAKRPAEERRATALLAGLWSVDLKMPDAKQRFAADAGGLDARQRLALRRMIISHDYASRFARTAIDGVAVDLDGVIRLGLVEDLGAEIRLHPLLRRTILEIDPDTAEIATLLQELERPETSHERRRDIGARLDALGDPRRGVGVGPDGTPELCWYPVPGSTVVIEDERRTQKHVKAFHIARYPVTVAQYRGFLEADDGWRDESWWAEDLQRDEKGASIKVGTRSNYPAVQVSWFDAVAFCRWSSQRLGFTVRLPDEWEWQQAASGGGARKVFPLGVDWDDKAEPLRANTSESNFWRVKAVKMYPTSAAPTGTLALAGTVWEWCLNKFEIEKVEETRSSAVDFDSRVLRGGSSPFLKATARSAVRNGSSPDFRNDLVGFRVVCSSPSSGTDP